MLHFGVIWFSYGNCFYNLIGSYKLDLHLTMMWLYFVFKLERGLIFGFLDCIERQKNVPSKKYLPSQEKTNLKVMNLWNQHTLLGLHISFMCYINYFNGLSCMIYFQKCLCSLIFLLFVFFCLTCYDKNLGAIMDRKGKPQWPICMPRLVNGTAITFHSADGKSPELLGCVINVTNLFTFFGH